MTSASEPPQPATKALREVQEVAWLTLALAQRLQEGYAQHAAGVGLTATQAKVLMALESDQPVSQRELADTLGLDPSNLTTLIDRLEERREVRREPGKDDRRVKMLVLTPRGHATRDTFATALRGDPGPLAGLSRSQLRQLRDQLRTTLQF